jgi:pectate lyase
MKFKKGRIPATIAQIFFVGCPQKVRLEVKFAKYRKRNSMNNSKRKLLLILLVAFVACKKTTSSYRLESTVPVITSPGVPDPLFAVAGFATQNGGTTGGQGGPEIVVTSYSELRLQLESSGKKVVKVNGRIYNGTKGGRINLSSDKTLVGVGKDAFLDGIGLSIAGKSNIIIQHVKISLVSITDRTDPTVYDIDGDEGRPQIIVNGGDAISISNSSSNIWIDHCEMFAEDPSVQTNQDLYDGLIDIKNSSQFITVSWNYFHDHHKTHLVGSSDTDEFDRKITFHHNYYNNIRSRLPLYRFGSAHIYNNYYYNVGGSAIDSRMGACLRIENNVFEAVKSPVVSSGSIPGAYQIQGNLFNQISGTAAPVTSTCSFTPTYSYSADPATAVKAGVTAKAGVGKI